MTVDEVNDILNKKSGALGISGVSSDFRDIEEAAKGGNKRAQLALDMFEYSVKRYIGLYATVMGGLDAIVFTAGIGENNISLRENLLTDMEFMGITVDSEKNNVQGKEAEITGAGSRVRSFVIPTNEELTIALDTQKLLG